MSLKVLGKHKFLVQIRVLCRKPSSADESWLTRRLHWSWCSGQYAYFTTMWCAYTVFCNHVRNAERYSVQSLHCFACYILQCVIQCSVHTVHSVLQYTVCYNYIVQCVTLYSALNYTVCYIVQFAVCYSIQCVTITLHSV